MSEEDLEEVEEETESVNSELGDVFVYCSKCNFFKQQLFKISTEPKSYNLHLLCINCGAYSIFKLEKSESDKKQDKAPGYLG